MAGNCNCPPILAWSVKDQDVGVSDTLFDHIGIAQCFLDLSFMATHVPVFLTDDAFPIFIGRPNRETKWGQDFKPDNSHALL